MIFIKNKQAFTLVELIIVITILAILSSIAFISFNGYVLKSRDTKRLSNLKTIEKGLLLFEANISKYPEPANPKIVSINGEKIINIGEVDKSLTSILKLSEIPTDEVTQKNYIYATNSKNKSYQLLGYFEGEIVYNSKVYADNKAYLENTIGNGVGILTQSGEIIKNNVDLFTTNSGTTFGLLLPCREEREELGIDLLGLEMLSEKNGNYSAPTSCPEGFIPVVGSQEFYQPGFCVAKYEMGYEGVDFPNTTLGPDWNTVIYDSSKKPVSKSLLYPIAEITQTQAIFSCESIGGHLITNNEWMTIARQIEANSINWSSLEVGNGYIYNGISGSSMGCSGITNTIYTNLPRSWASKTGGGFGNDNCDKKRQLTLSNGEIIWDFSGNVWEHVNKANTISGLGNNLGLTIFDENSGNWDGTYQWHLTGWSSSSIEDNIREKYGPSNSSYNHTSNGIGNIHGIKNLLSNNIFLRGGKSNNSDDIGIYSLRLSWYTSSLSNYTGFRCAY